MAGTKIWAGCGNRYPRFELFGEVETPASESGNATPYPPKLKNFGGLRIAVREVKDDSDDPGAFNTLYFFPIAFEKPLALNTQGTLIEDFNFEVGEKIVFEGLENVSQKLFDLVMTYGWKLELSRPSLRIHQIKLIMASDWELDTIPDYFPGKTKGEAILIARFGPNVQASDRLKIGITWPFSVQSRLQLENPQWTGTRWRATLDAENFNSLMDGIGGALRNFSIGSINLSNVLSKVINRVSQGLEKIDDFLFIEAGKGENEIPFFEIEITTPETTELASMAGLRLLLIGRAALAMKLEFMDESLRLSFAIKLGVPVRDDQQLNLDTSTIEANQMTGIKLSGPLITKIQEAASFTREVAALLPIDGAPQLPEIEFVYEFKFLDKFQELSLGKVDIPLRWNVPVISSPALGFLSGLDLKIPEPTLQLLEGLKLGGLDGGFPKVSLEITKASNYNSNGSIGLDLSILIQFQLLDNLIPIRCRWLMLFDLNALAFDPTAAIEIEVATREIDLHGLKITGLDSMRAKWESGGLVFTASGLKAYYSKLNDESETSKGFELIVNNLKLDAGGIDIDLSVVGGVTKLAGLGEAFKGAEGKVIIERSIFKSGFIKAEGALPWFDNATGSLTINFVENFKLGSVAADFQLGFHHKTDWWVELDLKSVGMNLIFSGDKPKLILKITGKISIVPPEDAGESILSYLDSASLEFKDLVLTSAFDSIPPGINLTVVLSKPAKVNILGAFVFEMRSIGIGSGFEAGQAAINIGGQIFFCEEDMKNNDPEFHKFRIGNPAVGEILPRIALEKLPVNLPLKPAVNVTGSLKYMETSTWSGFKGDGQLTINNTIHINIIMEFASVLRASDDKKVRVWMLFAEYEDLNIKLLDKIYLRDIGVGFGWRKTLTILNDPLKLLETPTQKTMAIGPHLPTSWVDDIETEGESAKWTVALSAWATYGLGDTTNSETNRHDRQNKSMPLVADLVLAIRSDLTFILFMRGWIFAALDKIKKGSNQKPAMIGLLYYSARNSHLLASYMVDPSASTPEGIPPALIKALIKNPFNFLLETKPGLFRIELGWPRNLSFPLGIYTGRAGFLMRTTPNALTIGVGFEISIDKHYSYGFGFGVGNFSIDIRIYIGVYGLIMARIGNKPALYGQVGIDALIIISLSLSVNFKIAFIRIRFSINIGITLAISARVEFGVSDAGFGVAGYATASLRIWTFNLSAGISFSINEGALNVARSRVMEGVTMAGDSYRKPPPVLPHPSIGVPALSESKPQWRIMQVRRGLNIYMMLLPDNDAWFACPKSKNSESTDSFESIGNEYQTQFHLENARLIEHAANLEIVNDSQQLFTASATMLWNKEIKIADKPISEGESLPDNSNDKFEFYDTTILGHLFFEPEEVQTEQLILKAILNSPEVQPELIEDWRVRSITRSEQDEDLAPGSRPDVRSPKFNPEGSLYDLALEEAYKYELDDCFSWQQLAIAKSRWTRDVLGRPSVVEYMLGDDVAPKGKFSADPSYINRKTLLKGAETMMGNRGALLSEMINQFGQWINSEYALEKFELLNNSGLAYKFEVPSQNDGDFTIEVKQHIVDRGYGKRDTIEGELLRDATTTQSNEGIGFRKEGFSYTIKDIIDFQDKDGIHFAWQFECISPDHASIIMHASDGSGLNPTTDVFQYLDYILVERTNLSSQVDNSRVEEQVKTAYVPALLNIGVDNRKFYLIVPRFNYSDLFKNPADVGDLLSYRFTPVDIFGNPGNTTELLTSRKDLEAPPPPDKASVYYTAELSSGNLPAESLSIEITIDRAAKFAHDKKVTYEVWYKKISISDGGFYGFGDDGNISLDESSIDPIVLPRGMILFDVLNNLHEDFAYEKIQTLEYGNVYEFHVRAVSSNGNASRLVRCENWVAVSKANTLAKESRSHGYIERIPPPSELSAEWLKTEELNFEIVPFRYPAPARTNPAFQNDPWFRLISSRDPEEREVLLTITHEDFVDDAKAYPTGGYEIYVRDRDTSLSDDISYYEKVASIEILPERLYRTNPVNSVIYSKWLSAFTSDDQQNNADYLSGNCLDWGNVVILESLGNLSYESGSENQSNQFFEPVPGEIIFDPRLKQILIRLHFWCRENKAYLRIVNGGISLNALKEVSFEYLQSKFNEQRDPYGIGLLLWLGRSADITILKDNVALNAKEIHEILSKESVQIDQLIGIEMLFNSDKDTTMQYIRISLLPHHRIAQSDQDKLRSAKQFIDQLNQLRRQALLDGIIDVAMNASGYTGLTNSFLKNIAAKEKSPLLFITSWYNDEGNFSRTPKGGEITCALYFKEPYARRLAYRVKRIDRYFHLLKELQLIPADPDELPNGLFVRIPRVIIPEPPVVTFMGNFSDKNNWYSQWLIREHEEQTLVQSNETLRNRLGFRSIAWSLFVSMHPGWKKWSGWESKSGWLQRSPYTSDGGVPGLSPYEKTLLNTGAIWDRDSNEIEEYIGDHPFTEHLSPKGLVIRIPKLPYYYSYRLAAFCRTDDVDSIAKLSDPVQSTPIVIPSLDKTYAGWELKNNDLIFWWRIPSVWESFNDEQKQTWINEEPFATRVWDYDIHFIIQMSRNCVVTPLTYIKPATPSADEKEAALKPYTVVTSGRDLFWKEAGKIETQNGVTQKTRYNPQLLLKFNVSDTLKKALLIESDFEFEIKCIRNYGTDRQSVTKLKRKTEKL